jgi:hypothetical protein
MNLLTDARSDGAGFIEGGNVKGARSFSCVWLLFVLFYNAAHVFLALQGRFPFGSPIPSRYF